MRIGDVTLKLDKQHESELAKHLGEPVVLGIRPEHIVDRRLLSDGSEANVVNTRIDVVEPLGNETFLYLVPLLGLGGSTFVARMGPETYAQPGQECEVVFDVTKAHVFEKESGQAIV